MNHHAKNWTNDLLQVTSQDELDSFDELFNELLDDDEFFNVLIFISQVEEQSMAQVEPMVEGGAAHEDFQGKCIPAVQE